ncbi:MAG: SDR family NAD(P)-dependent oxidoreductase, partial [Spirosomaceae bacterium]|nr:SDR family NAD(P)-dependent oxidoreductase [Spirosomataceae bacterium]
MTISILGCGWLGLPLAKSLVSKGFTVKGSTTSEGKIKELKAAKIQPFLLKLEPKIEGENVDEFFNSELLFINIPPGLRVNSADYYTQQLQSLMKAVNTSTVQKIIFISTTSVYSELNREVTEIDADQEHPLYKAEQFITQNAQNKQVTILRCGGLMGYERIPAKYFAGKKGLTTGDIRVNYVHRDDVIGIVEMIIEKEIYGETFNVVAPEHPTRKEVYEKACLEHNYEIPEFVTPKEPHDFKVISPKKLLGFTDYKFKYANPLD